MLKTTIFCSVMGAAIAFGPPGGGGPGGGIGGPGNGGPGGIGLPTIPTTPAASTRPLPISRNGAPLPTLEPVGAIGDENVAGGIGSFGSLPEFLRDSRAFLSTAPYAVDQGINFECETSTTGEDYPCIYYVVFQNCGSCTENSNGGLPATLSVQSGFSLERSCSPRFTPPGVTGESYPTAFFKGEVARGESVEIFMDRPATAFAVFDGTETQCSNLLTQRCNARSDCLESMAGPCVNADTVCPPRLHRGPFTPGGSCPSCF